MRVLAGVDGYRCEGTGVGGCRRETGREMDGHTHRGVQYTRDRVDRRRRQSEAEMSSDERSTRRVINRQRRSPDRYSLHRELCTGCSIAANTTH